MPDSPHHILLLDPTDVLFFKDGRPMEGASTGHGAAWPHPHVLNAALHAALWRSKEDFDSLHEHRFGRSGSFDDDRRDRLFGSLQTAGPFPCGSPDPRGGVPEAWYFPRPADAQDGGSAEITLAPLDPAAVPGAASSLHEKLRPVVNRRPPSKATPEPWLSAAAYQAYLSGGDAPTPASHLFLKDDAIHAAEHTVGIGMDPETGTQDGERIYSAAYLRMRPGWRLGLAAACADKKGGDLVKKLFPNAGARTAILVGGQQRTGTVERKTPGRLPLPVGPEIEGTRVKWTLLSPAIFPRLPANEAKDVPEHPGGWLPTWIHPDTLQVNLRTGPGHNKAKRLRVPEGRPIVAHLVAAVVPKPLVITGWALKDQDDQGREQPGGARATHLAVPAGAVYYFETGSPEDAAALADALNWHGRTTGGSGIVNRRSSLLGEKGFGLGVCSGWRPRTTSWPFHMTT